MSVLSMASMGPALANPWLGPLLIAGSTLASVIGGENERIRAQKLKAAEIRAQPWTGNAPQTQLRGSNIWGALAQGATAAGMSHANSQQQAVDNQFRSDLLSTMRGGAPAQAAKTAAEASVVPMSPPPSSAIQQPPPMPQLPRENYWENPEQMRSDLPDYMRKSPQGGQMSPPIWKGLNPMLDPRFQSTLSG